MGVFAVGSGEASILVCTIQVHIGRGGLQVGRILLLLCLLCINTILYLRVSSRQIFPERDRQA